MSGVEVYLQQFVGRQKGLVVSKPLDRIWVARDGGKSHIGYVARYDGASCVFIRHLPMEDCRALVEEVRKIRNEEFDMATGDKFGRLPDPKAIKAYVKGELKKPKPTTIVMPDGTPASSDTEDTTEDQIDE